MNIRFGVCATLGQTSIKLSGVVNLFIVCVDCNGFDRKRIRSPGYNLIRHMIF